MKKETKKTKEFSKERKFTVILEKVYAEIKLMGEGQNAIKDKLDSAMGMIARNTEDITMLNMSVSVIKSDITKINGKLAQIEEDLRLVKNEFGKRLTQLETAK
jgi:uncharacterized membrane protein